MRAKTHLDYIVRHNLGYCEGRIVELITDWSTTEDLAEIENYLTILKNGNALHTIDPLPREPLIPRRKSDLDELKDQRAIHGHTQYANNGNDQER